MSDNFLPGLDDVAPSSFQYERVPDALFPSDNDFGIPLLNVHKQAEYIVLPMTRWGSVKRTTTMEGTWHFYSEDYRFSGLWKNPNALVETGCVGIVEPNYSCYEQMPLAVGLYRIYQKRWLACYWQSKGINVIVDLNVSSVYKKVNLLGVPKGWNAFATRGYSDRVTEINDEYALACEHSHRKDILFFVYGGGKAVLQECQKHGYVWLPEESDVARGRYEHSGFIPEELKARLTFQSNDIVWQKQKDLPAVKTTEYVNVA